MDKPYKKLHLKPGLCSGPEYMMNSKKFAKIGLSTPGGGGFKPGFCCAPRFLLVHIALTKDAGF